MLRGTTQREIERVRQRDKRERERERERVRQTDRQTDRDRDREHLRGAVVVGEQADVPRVVEEDVAAKVAADRQTQQRQTEKE